MKHNKSLLTAAVVVGLLLCVQQTGSAFQSPEKDGANLGSAQSDLPPLPAPPKSLPPLPAPSKPGIPPKSDVPPTKANTTRTAADHAAAAQHFIQEGRYDIAIEASSLAIAADPKNADYLKIRAQAYQLTGRFEQALADTNPLEVVVAASQANLKSADDVVAVVPKGAVLNVSEVKGDWLKVETVGDQEFKWAWVWKRNLVRGQSQPRPQPLPQRVIIQRVVPADFYGRYYGGGYYDRGWRSGYGRAYYDWSRHVPRRYWGYLPW
jgi:tetratricopeptide (TPR) repeat protein